MNEIEAFLELLNVIPVLRQKVRASEAQEALNDLTSMIATSHAKYHVTLINQGIDKLQADKMTIAFIGKGLPLPSKS